MLSEGLRETGRSRRRMPANLFGRVRLPEDWSEIRIVLRLDKVIEHDYRPIWNVPPTESLPVVTSKEGGRTLAPMRWGLVLSVAITWFDRRYRLRHHQGLAARSARVKSR